jgi:CBS domain containing-hemolysin-like protein
LLHLLAGLATLIVLELVLGIDNLVFIAILANKLPAHQRDRARVMGLAMAMGIRLLMLAAMSKLVGLVHPILTIGEMSFSWRDIIMAIGGVFLIYKATSEIHERLEGHHETATKEKRVPTFAATLIQIVVLDAVFSLDSIITAVGMVEELWIMMTAVVASMALMIAASKPLTIFVSKRPTVIILCLSFLLLIGCSLIADGFGFHIPKTYLYAAIGFSLLIESLNQLGGFKNRKRILDKPMRERTADAILRLVMPHPEPHEVDELAPPAPVEAGGLHHDETQMIRGVISLGTLTAKSIMTLKPDIVWFDADRTDENLVPEMLDTGRSRVLVCRGSLDDVVGVVDVRDALRQSHARTTIDLKGLARSPLYVQDQAPVTQIIATMRRSDERFAIVVDETGDIEGVLTTTDIFAEIAGDLADDEDDGLMETKDGVMLADGMARMSDVERRLGVRLGEQSRSYETLSGHMLHVLKTIPKIGDQMVEAGHRFTVDQVDGRRMTRIAIEVADGSD